MKILSITLYIPGKQFLLDFVNKEITQKQLEEIHKNLGEILSGEVINNKGVKESTLHNVSFRIANNNKTLILPKGLLNQSYIIIETC